MFNRADNGDLILAYNPSATQRNPLVLATSPDGVSWTDFATLANNASVQESCMHFLVATTHVVSLQTSWFLFGFFCFFIFPAYAPQFSATSQYISPLFHRSNSIFNW
jgi:hypothetical protein